MIRLVDLHVIVVLCAGVLGGVGAVRAEQVPLAVEGEARAVIVVSPRVMADDDAAALGAAEFDVQQRERHRIRLRRSVRDLAHYLGQITGGTYEVTTEPPAAGEGRLPILIGELAEQRFGKPGVTAVYQQGFRVVVSPEAIGLIGESDLATSYAIYEVLDRLGCRWYIPSALGEVIPHQPDASLAAGDVSSAPYTWYRDIWYADDDYRRRNRLGGLRLEAGHALEGYVTPEQRQAHPEWVATIDGKPTEHRRLRWSAEGLPEAIAEHLIDYVDRTGAGTISLSPDDGVGYDNSAADRALDAGDFDPSTGEVSLTDRQVWFCNRIVERVVQEHPDVLFGMLAYAQSTRAPVREKLHPNLIPQIAPITYARAHPMTHDGEPNNADYRALVKGWGEQAQATSYYFYGWFLAETSAPNPFITKWSVNLPIIYEQGSCRLWQPETMPNFETTMHALYMGIRMAWDPNQDPLAIVDELNERFYGHAGEAMAEYWRLVDRAWIESDEYSGCGFGHLRRFPEPVLAKWRAAMDEALAACRTITEHRRVKMADDSLRMFELFMKLRRDFAAGNFAYLHQQVPLYQAMAMALGKAYEAQYAFTQLPYTRTLRTVHNKYFEVFYKSGYDDAIRITNDPSFQWLTPTPLRELHYQADPSGEAQQKGWLAADFDASGWPTTDPAVETWSSLGYHNYMGNMVYRTTATIDRSAAHRRVYLWLGGIDGSMKVYVNGKHVPYTGADGEPAEAPNGYCIPVSFDITETLREGEAQQITILADRTFINELGTGGLIGPVMIYAQQ